MTVQRNNTLMNMPDLGVTVSPVMIRNGAISHGALRLWLLMRSMPTDWRPTVGGFATIMRRRGMRTGYDTVARWCRQLKDTGYLKITKVRDVNQHIGWAWATYPVPVEEYIKQQAEHAEAIGVA